MVQNTPTGYFAFISYSHSDEKWARWIQNEIEKYCIPLELRKSRNDIPKRFFPCFRDRTDIGINILSDELKRNLDNSNFLIVVCSPHAAKSSWVEEEVKYFIETGKQNKIIPFIVDGSPYSDNQNECYPKSLRDTFQKNDPQKHGNEILGASIYDSNGNTNRHSKKMALVRIIARMCDVKFDDLWNRNIRRKKRTSFVLLLTSLVITTIAGTIIHSFLPQKIKIRLHEVSHHNSNLPQLKNASVSIYYKYKGSIDSSKTVIKNLSDIEFLKNIPASIMRQKVRLVFECDDYIRIDTTMEMRKHVDINVRRNDSVYGYLNLLLTDEKNGDPLTNTEIYVNADTFKTDPKGVLNCIIPLQRQNTIYKFKRKGSGENVTELPISNLKNLYKTSNQYIFTIK